MTKLTIPAAQLTISVVQSTISMAQTTISMVLRELLRHKPWAAAGRGHGKQSALDIWSVKGAS